MRSLQTSSVKRRAWGGRGLTRPDGSLRGDSWTQAQAQVSAPDSEGGDGAVHPAAWERRGRAAAPRRRGRACSRPSPESPAGASPAARDPRLQPAELRACVLSEPQSQRPLQPRLMPSMWVSGSPLLSLRLLLEVGSVQHTKRAQSHRTALFSYYCGVMKLVP